MNADVESLDKASRGHVSGDGRARSPLQLTSQYEHVIQEMKEAGPDALLGAAALACSADRAEARRKLKEHFGFPPSRASAAVRIGAALGTWHGRDPLGAIAGGRLSPSILKALDHIMGDTVEPHGPDAGPITVKALRSAASRHEVRKLATAAAKSRDKPTMLVAAALLASIGEELGQDFASVLQQGLAWPQEGLRRSTARTMANRVVASAFAIDGVNAGGLRLGPRSWRDGSTSWRFRAGLWALAADNVDAPATLCDLLDAANQRGLRFVLPGDHPFGDPGIATDVAYARDTAASAAPSLTKWFDRPVWFDGGPGQPQILMSQDDEYAYAWVGQSGKGMLVAFDTEEFVQYSLDEPGTMFATAAAIGWYIDVSIGLKKDPKGSSTMVRQAGGTKRSGHSYKPTAAFNRQLDDVTSGRATPPRPHRVAAFVRHLGPGKRPNPWHVAQAPKRLRANMGKGDTWVRAHDRGGTVAKVDWSVRLSQHSALADILGLIERRASGTD